LVGINRKFSVPRRIKDEAASATDRKHDITGWEMQRPGAIFDQQTAIGGNTQHFVK
jgi:hypothetical protein